MGIEKRILIVENDPGLQRAVKRRLASKGYTVFAADNAATALELLSQEHVHIAIIDVRLENHRDPDDLSGLELARKIGAPIAKIILTAYPSLETIKKSWKEVGATDFIEKGEESEVLLRAVDAVFRDDLNIRDDFTIKWDQDVTALSIFEEMGLSKDKPGYCQDEVVEVLVKLFAKREFDGIAVSYLMTPQRGQVSSQSGAVLLRVTPYHNNRQHASKVVKLAERADIEAEVDNYEQFVQPDIQTHRYASREGAPQYTLHVGGVIYAFLGVKADEVQDMHDFYHRHSAAEVLQLLDGLFSDTCRLWYGAREEMASFDICQYYWKMLGLTPEKLCTAVKEDLGLAEYQLDSATLRFGGLAHDFINPLTWSTRHCCTETEFCITHGDMHGRNILIDKQAQAWLIDFARTGRGHILRDFVELESDIKFVLLDETDVESLCDLELALLAPASLDKDPNSVKFGRPSLQKTIEVVAGLRELASQLYSPMDAREYYEALLYQTLNAVRLKHIGPLKKQHAFLAASLACERLRDWGRPWPPESLKRTVEPQPAVDDRQGV